MGIEWILKRFRLESSERANLHEERDPLEDFHKVSGQELTSRLSKQWSLSSQREDLSFIKDTGWYRHIYIHLANSL